jgi:hypothetical protein
MGHSTEFGYALWAIVQVLVLRYGPCSIWLFAVAHSAGFGYKLWVVVQDLVMRYLPLR